jgi:hypothetical protein
VNLYSIPENSLLLMQFRQFAGELIHQKKVLEVQFPLAPGAPAAPSLAEISQSAEEGTVMLAEVQRARGALLGVLEGQQTASRSSAEISRTASIARHST